MRRVSEDDRATIIRLYFDEGLGMSVLEERLGFSYETIRKIVRAEGDRRQREKEKEAAR